MRDSKLQHSSGWRRWLWLITGWLVMGAGTLCAAAGTGVVDGNLIADRNLAKLPVFKRPPAGILGSHPGGFDAQSLARYQEESVRRRRQIHDLLGWRRISQKSHDILRRRGLGPSRLVGDPGRIGGSEKQDVDLLKILLVRISFASDRSGALTSITTDGNFQLGPAGPDDRIDPPPHNRDFYEMHLFGLSEYYRLQSGGRLMIEGRVLPPGPEESYRLTDIADYGPGAGKVWTIAGLERLVRDMIAVTDSALASDADPDFSLADYDDDDPFSYVIFVHAGSDWQSDINGDSPNDIPTFFVNLGDPAALTGLDSETGLTGELTECSIIPETISQDGLLGSIGAGLYHEFGHALGLVDIYSTFTGLPQVGIWDLMDAGTNLVANVGFPNPAAPDSVDVFSIVGLLPPSLGAWDKWFLGWVELGTIDTPGALYHLPAVQVPRTDYPRYRDAGYGYRLSDPQVLVAGASRREFFLIENRWVPLDGDELPELTGIGFVQDEQTGVILYLGGDPDPVTQIPRNTGMYDFFLPDGGLLVWHANLDRIEANLATNTINAYGDGLRLIEADGIQDIGVVEPYVLGFFGSEADPFNVRNGDALYLEGAPSSRAFDRSWTGLELAGIQGSSRGEGVMELTGAVTPLAAGTPWTAPAIDEAEALSLGGESGPRRLAAGSITPFRLDGLERLIIADAPRVDWTGDSYRAKLFVLDPGAQPATDPPDPALPLGAAWEFSAPLAGPPLVTERVGGPLIVGLRDGNVLAFRPDLDALGRLQLFAGPVAVGASLAYAPLAGGGERLLCCVSPDTLVLLDADLQRLGEPVWLTVPGAESRVEHVAPPLCLNPLNSGFDGGFAVFTRSGWFRVVGDVSGFASEAEFYPYPIEPTGTVRRALVPLQEESLLALFDATGEVGAWRLSAAGAVEAASLTAEMRSGPISEPAVADLDGDGRNDLVLLTRERVYALRSDGVPLTGYPVRLSELFPLPDTTRIAGPAVVCDATGDGINEVFFCTNIGHLIGLSARGALLPRMPFLWGTRDPSTMLVTPGTSPSERRLWMVEAGGWRGPPHDRRLFDGRLVAYRLIGSGPAPSVTSEWLGEEGGGHRRGPEGVPAALAGETPWGDDAQRVLFYPNPLQGERLQVRFFSKSADAARLAIYNLEGEVVLRLDLAAEAGKINDKRVQVGQLASGLYICRLEFEGANGPQKEFVNLAVER